MIAFLIPSLDRIDWKRYYLPSTVIISTRKEFLCTLSLKDIVVFLMKFSSIKIKIILFGKSVGNLVREGHGVEEFSIVRRGFIIHKVFSESVDLHIIVGMS